MSEAVVALVGALLGGLAAVGGAAVQAHSARKLEDQRAAREEARRREETIEQAHKHRRSLARRYLFQYKDAVDSVLHRVDNWARQGGQQHAERRDPGYWDATTLYAVGRALGAERLLSLEAVYVELEALSDDPGVRLRQRAVDDALDHVMGDYLFHYHRLALAEAVVERDGDSFRLLTYTEFRRRYDDPAWNLELLLEPARDALNALTPGSLDSLEDSLRKVSERVAKLIAPTSTGRGA
jgi:hypothetical protein